MLKLAKEEVKNLKELLNVEGDVEIEIEEGDEGIQYVKVAFEGEDLGYMIGNRGRHLDSLQFMLQILLGRKMSDEERETFRVFVDVGGYRKEKDDKIAKMALEKADDARILGAPVELPPMKPSDRRIVHLTLIKFKDISTESEGEGMDRHIVIKPVK